MIALRRRAADSPLPILATGLVLLAILASACGPATSPSPTARTSGPDPTPVPGSSATPALQPSVVLPTTTGTDFGTIWDALPPSWPQLPGQQPAETGAGPTSGSFAVNMPPADAARLLAAALTRLGWTVDAGSPLEDGTVVLDAFGAREGCAAEVRITPLSGTVVMSVLYGAECPFS